MEKLTKDKLQAILTSGLSLKDPEFHLEKVSGLLVGHIISPSFRGKRDHQRQNAIWDVLEAKFGTEAVKLVGMLLAYTPEEWGVGGDETVTTRKRKKVG
jgi:acid stress-induced BolA-like protein IbaG/YrbA